MFEYLVFHIFNGFHRIFLGTALPTNQLYQQMDSLFSFCVVITIQRSNMLINITVDRFHYSIIYLVSNGPRKCNACVLPKLP